MIDSWLESNDLNDAFKKELKCTKTNTKELFYQDIPFGTGGMRGLIGAGTNRINEIMISKATNGFATYLEQKNSGSNIEVIIGYDNRQYSYEFAIQAAKVLSARNIKAFIFSTLTATPLVSYAIRRKKAHGGIVITASHNPPEYNGFKIYDETGCQLLPREIDQVVSIIKNISNVTDIKTNLENVFFLDDICQNNYINELRGLIHHENEVKEIAIGFSPQHGTALNPVKKMLAQYGYPKVIIVEEQATFDPNFSGTKSANPEDESSFELLKEYGERFKLDILLTTDPDADRVGVAYRDANEKYHCLTGNQVGALLIDYYLKINAQQNNANLYIVKTIVTSNLGAEIAREHKVKVLNVLTGFKYIGDKINKYGEENFLLGYEESYGYLVYPITRDKDGIQIILAITEMAYFYQQQGKTLGNQLEELYKKYGYHKEQLISRTFSGKSGAAKIAEIYYRFKHHKWENVEYIEDYEKLEVRNIPEQTEQVLETDKSMVIKVTFLDGSWLCVRPSGTEPKIKIYLGVCEKSEEKATEKIQKLYDTVNIML